MENPHLKWMMTWATPMTLDTSIWFCWISITKPYPVVVQVAMFFFGISFGVSSNYIKLIKVDIFDLGYSSVKYQTISNMIYQTKISNYIKYQYVKYQTWYIKLSHIMWNIYCCDGRSGNGAAADPSAHARHVSHAALEVYELDGLINIFTL